VRNPSAQHRPGTARTHPAGRWAEVKPLPVGSSPPGNAGAESGVTPAHDLHGQRGQDQTPELAPKAALGPINWANRANKWMPPKKGGGRVRKAGLACLHTRGAPRGAGESQNLPSATPLPSWRALGSRFPVKKIRFGSAGWLQNPHASDLKEKRAQAKLSTNVKITQPGVCLPRLRRSGDVYELRVGRQRPIPLGDFASSPACAQPRPYVPAAAGRRARWNQGER